MTGLRVASFPATHPYVDAVRPAGVEAVCPAQRTGAPPWAPHPWWDGHELARNADAVDLLHVHFGYDHLDLGQLQAWTAAVARLRLPLVLTVHDLRNPHHDAAAQHTAHLGELLTHAGHVLTLTPAAASAIAARWHRSATVVAHPSLIAPRRPRPANRGPRTVGVHLKSLRRNLVEPGRVVAAIADGAAAAGGRFVVDVHPDAAADAALADVHRLASTGALQLRVHGRYTDDELVQYLRSLDVSVLPQRFGTHSGWLEACRDVGTRVVAPDCGYYAQQWDAVHSYGNSETDGLDPGSLRRAVAKALTAPPLAPADPAARAAERDAVRRVHAAIYQQAQEVRCLARG